MPKRQNKQHYVFIAAFLVWVFLKSDKHLFATSFYPVPFEERVKNTALIIRGTVGEVYADWSEDEQGNRRIYTFADLNVEEVLKPQGTDFPKQILVRELGGEKDGVGMLVAGTAELKKGQDTVLMLGPKNSEDSYDIQGMMMGQYIVKKDGSGQDALEGGGLTPWTDWRQKVAHDLGKNQQVKTKWTLDDLRRLIQTPQNKEDLKQPEKISDSLKNTANQSTIEESTVVEKEALHRRRPAGYIISLGLLLGGIAYLIKKRR